MCLPRLGIVSTPLLQLYRSVLCPLAFGPWYLLFLLYAILPNQISSDSFGSALREACQTFLTRTNPPLKSLSPGTRHLSMKYTHAIAISP